MLLVQFLRRCQMHRTAQVKNKNMDIIFFLPIIIIFAKFQCIQTRKCYVCGPEAPEPFKQSTPTTMANNNNNRSMFGNISSCEEFDQSTNLKKFEFECPDGYMGCITQIDDSSVIRTCDILAINDCETANGIKYCYCDTDLCNKMKQAITTATATATATATKTTSGRQRNVNINRDTTDDEDMLDTEASGSIGDKTYDVDDDDEDDEEDDEDNDDENDDDVVNDNINNKSMKNKNNSSTPPAMTTTTTYSILATHAKRNLTTNASCSAATAAVWTMKNYSRLIFLILLLMHHHQTFR